MTNIVLVEKADGVATVTLNRPEALNALNATLKTSLAEAIEDIQSDDSVRAMLLTGTGRAFCAGGDISEMDPERAPEQARRRQTTLLNRVFLPLHRLDKPVVAAVNGHAHGGGLALALACDIVLAGSSAVMSLGYVQRGIAADCGILYFLPRRVGMGRAKHLLFTGRRFSAAEAERWGIVDGVVPDDELLTEARQLTADLARSATVAIAATKRILNESLRSSFEDLVELEAYSQAVTRGTVDHREGVRSFLEKRPATFVGK